MYDREPLYVISVAARLLDMHAQTLRKYEREQFIKPSRTQGRLRLYSAADIERLRQVNHLVKHVGLNLAGVQLALAMSQRLSALRDGVRDAESQEAATECVEREVRELLRALGVPDSRPGRQEPTGNGHAGDQQAAREPRATADEAVPRRTPR
ncbi:MAG: HspR, transcriptional repressor of DnaK operon [uncultured Thermomicrobiales bacterium]|uniref:HspR, transcriptional repressor of DnaK operon n=1 Tax=uncultured Thermomicrobiales bacterium TaxID=1645740 RepID=A0A6J4VGY6_9BACT|nr:MAG: HspR, transcriptional repressor of DnaK operon [uncultured Thermomicrobiales bacterium]